MPKRHNIFNNPNISNTHISSPSKPTPRASSRYTRAVPVSPPVPSVPVSHEPNQSVSNNKETQKRSKGSAPYQITNRTNKKPRVANKKPTKSVKLNQVVNHQIKKNDTIVPNTYIPKSIPSTSNAVIQSTQEVNSVQSTNEELKSSNSELNCKDSSSHLDNDKKDNGFYKKYCIFNKEFLSQHLNIDNEDATKKPHNSINQSNVIDINKSQKQTIIQQQSSKQTIKPSYIIKRRSTSTNISLKTQHSAINQTDPKHHKTADESIINSSPCLQLPKDACSSSTSTNFKKSTASQKNINSINQPNVIDINKSQKQTIIQQQSSKQTIKPSYIIKRRSTSTNISLITQHSAINQTDPKHHKTADESIINSSPCLQLPKDACSSSTSTNFKKSTASQKNINSINQPNVIDINKSQKQTIIQQQSSKQTIKPSYIIKRRSTSTTISLKTQHSAINQTDPKHHKTADESIINSSPCLQLPKDDCSSSTSTNFKKSTASQKNINSINQPNVIDINKSQKQTIIQQQSSKQTIKPSYIIKRRSTSTNISLKTQHSAINQTDPKHHNVKPAIMLQSSIDDLIKCIKCNAFSKDQTCSTCQMFPYLKNVTDTEIGTPSTSAVVHPGSPFITSSKTIDVPSSCINYVSCEEPQIILLSSGDEDEESLEPIISKKENKEALKKHTDQTVPNCSNRLSTTKPANDSFKQLGNILMLNDEFDGITKTIRINDYKMLNSKTFINDKLIEFYLNYWYTQKLSNEDKNRTYIIGTHFYNSLTRPFDTSSYPSHYTVSQIRHGHVKNWTKTIDIFKKDFVFIPINENYHWYMAVICFPYLSGKVNMIDGTPVNAPDDTAGRYTPPPTNDIVDGRIEADPNVEDLWLFDIASTANLIIKQGVDYETDVAVTKKSRRIQVKRPCILMFDSLSGGVKRARITARLRDWLEQEYMAKYNGKKKDFSPQAIKGALLRLPQQPNSTDCGLFVLHFFKTFFERPIVDYTLPIRHLENWFSIDEVVKNHQTRRELQSIILTRMKERGSVLPDDIKLPILDINNP